MIFLLCDNHDVIITAQSSSLLINDYDYELSNIYSKIGNEYFRNLTFEDAITYYKKAVNLNYFHVPALVNLGVVYVEQDNLVEGEKYFKQANERSGEYLYHVQNGLGSIYLQRGNGAKAFTHFMNSVIIAKNKLDPSVDVYEYQQSLSNIGLVLRSASSSDIDDIRTQLKAYNLPIDYRYYFKKALEIVIDDINVYRNFHKLKCLIHIIQPGKWEKKTMIKKKVTIDLKSPPTTISETKGKVQLLKSYNSFHLQNGLFYGKKPKTVGDGKSKIIMTEPMNDFSPYYHIKSSGTMKEDILFVYKDRSTNLYSISNIHIDGRVVGTIHDGCNVFLRSNDYLPPASIFGKLTMDMPDIGDSNYIQKHFKYAINIVSRWTDNYYHFLIESIPRLIIMLKEQSTILNKILNEKDVNHKMKKYDKKKIITIPIIVQKGPSYIKELLNIIIENHMKMSTTVNEDETVNLNYSIEYLSDNEIYHVEQMFTIESHGDRNVFNLETAGSRYALQEAQMYFNSIFFSSYSNSSSLHRNNNMNDNNVVIFVSRSLFHCGDEKYETQHLKGVPKKRLLSNHDDVIQAIKMHVDALRKKKIYEFKIENGCQTMKETIQMWKNAHTIVGVHGAGLSNMIFTKSSIHHSNNKNNYYEYDDDNVVTLIEITPLEPAFRDYFHLASSLNIKLWAIAMAKEGMRNSYLAHQIKLNIGVLRNILKVVVK